LGIFCCWPNQQHYGLKRWAGPEDEIFQHTLQISDGILKDSCKYLTEEIMAAENFNFTLKLYTVSGKKLIP